MVHHTPRVRRILLSIATICMIVTQFMMPSGVAKAASLYTIAGSVVNGNGYTFMAVAASGRVIFSQTLSGNPATLTSNSGNTEEISTTKGVNFQLVAPDGKYFGPIILGWKGNTLNRAGVVYTVLKEQSNTTINLGTITVTPTSNGQGYGVVGTKYQYATGTTKARAGVPLGIGKAGKTRLVAANTGTATQRNGSPKFMDGSDADSDGVINAFDVDDDGDGKFDYVDKPPPTTFGDCTTQAAFTLFSNFKATDPNFAGTINSYGPSGSAYEATNTNIATALTNTLTFAIQRINQVCGSNVTKVEFKGIGVAYAPSSYVELPSGGQDVQWQVGAGTMNGSPVTGLSSYTFLCSGTCELSGQDTFMQRVTTADGNEYEFMTSPTFIFVTHPMLVSYRVNTGSVVSSDYSLPNIAGSQNNRITVRGTDRLTIRLYRPQRLALPGEPASFYDIGGLNYVPDMPNGINGSGIGPGRCDTAMAKDRLMPADKAINTGAKPVLGMTIDMRKIKACYERSRGAGSWGAGNADFDIQVLAPVSNSGNAAQKLYLTIIP